MKPNSKIILFTALAFVVGVSVGVFAVKFLAPQPEILVKMALEGQNFKIDVPHKLRPDIEDLANSLQKLDLPIMLDLNYPNHSEISAAWKQSPFKTSVIPFGINIINVTSMIPRYVSSDPNDKKYCELAKLLNKELDASILGILETEVNEKNRITIPTIVEEVK